VFEDREGNLWVATRSGLDRLRDGTVRTYTHREGLGNSSGPIVAADDGAIWSVSAERIARIAANGIREWQSPLRSYRTPRTFAPRTVLSQPGSHFLIFDRGVTAGVRNALNWSRERQRWMFGVYLRHVTEAFGSALRIEACSDGDRHWDLNQYSRRVFRTGPSNRLLKITTEQSGRAAIQVAVSTE